jgi:hypothetical protein
MSLHPVLTEHPAIARTQARVDSTRAAVDAVPVRDREALGQWEADAVAAARAGRPCPDRPSPTPHEALEALRRDLINAQRVHNAALIDVAPEVEQAARERQSAIMAEVADLEAQLDNLARELHSLAGACNESGRAQGITLDRHAMNLPTAVELLKAARAGDVWVKSAEVEEVEL